MLPRSYGENMAVGVCGNQVSFLFNHLFFPIPEIFPICPSSTLAAKHPPKRKQPRISPGLFFCESAFLSYAAAFFSSVSAALALFTRSVKPAASLMAMSESTLR